MIKLLISWIFTLLRKVVNLRDIQCANGVSNKWEFNYNTFVCEFLSWYLKMDIKVSRNPMMYGLFIENKRCSFPFNLLDENLKEVCFLYKIKKEDLEWIEEMIKWDRQEYPRC